MNTEEIMKLADAYAAAYMSFSESKARAALEAALSAKQGEQQPALSTASKSEQLLASQDHALRAEFQRMKAALAQQGEQQPDVLAEYTRTDGYRQWESVGAWLYPGDKIAVISAGAAPAAQPDTRTVVQQMVDALNIGIAKHYDLAEDVRVGDAIQAGQKLLKELK